MRILALDQASRTSGWAVFDEGKLVTFDKFTADHSDVGDRLHFIRSKVNSLINEYDIDEVVFEDIQLQGNVANNVATFKALAEVFGVLYELFVTLKMPRTAVLSTVWKSTLGIKGKDRPAQKKAAQAWVEKTYGVKPTQDECDAICIGAHYVNNKVEVFDWS